MLNMQTQYTGDLSRIMAGLNRGLTDLRPLTREMIRILDDGNRKGIGKDVAGNTLAPLTFSTLMRNRRGGSGPPLAPRGLSSRIFAGVTFDSSGTGGALAVEMTWAAQPWLKYHRTGTTRMKARDVTSGLRPQTLVEVRLELYQYFQSLLRVR